MIYPVFRPLPNNKPVPDKNPKILPDYSVIPPVATIRLQDFSDRAALTAASVNPLVQNASLQTVGYPTYNPATQLWEVYGLPNGNYKLLILGARFQTITIDPFVINSAIPAHAAQDVMQVQYSNLSVYAYPNGPGPLVISSASLNHPYGGTVSNGSVFGSNYASFPPTPGGTYVLIVTANNYVTYSGTYVLSADYSGPGVTMNPTGGGGVE